MQPKLIVPPRQFEIIITRLCYQLIENHHDFSSSVIVGLQPRGIYLSKRIVSRLKGILPSANILNGSLDITFFRDDFRHHEKPLVPSDTDINFMVEDKNVVLIDDVLYTGRTIRAGLDAILSFGRPRKVELLVLIHRKFSRHLPIEPDYTGLSIDTISSDKVKVEWKETDGEDKVWLFSNAKENEPAANR
jgi:pyrimidine operon attenuation protein/uracil phosphoribosyltransferase